MQWYAVLFSERSLVLLHALFPRLSPPRMSDVTGGLESLSGDLAPLVVVALVVASFAGSFVTAALGIGGGVMLLAVMAVLLPPSALIPVHGIIQLGSNVGRTAVLLRHVYWPPLLAFSVGSLIGAVGGGLVAIELPPPAVQICVGAFVIWSVLARPPKWFSGFPAITGVVSSFLTMFFGATGVFVATYTKALNLSRQGIVGTHAAFMTVQHCLKIVVFGLLGFAYGPWIGIMVLMILSGLIGTLLGKRVLERMTDNGFRRAFDILLLLVAARLIWGGMSSLGLF